MTFISWSSDSSEYLLHFVMELHCTWPLTLFYGVASHLVSYTFFMELHCTWSLTLFYGVALYLVSYTFLWSCITLGLLHFFMELHCTWPLTLFYGVASHLD